MEVSEEPYADKYLNSSLPDHVQLLLLRLKELDAKYIVQLKEAELQTEIYSAPGPENAVAFTRMQLALMHAKNLGTEKINLLNKILGEVYPNYPKQEPESEDEQT